MTYHIEYKLHSADKIRSLDIVAKNKADAYDKAVYEAIPDREKEMPYSAWLVSVTYNNGNYRRFNNFEGNPY